MIEETLIIIMEFCEGIQINNQTQINHIYLENQSFLHFQIIKRILFTYFWFYSLVWFYSILSFRFEFHFNIKTEGDLAFHIKRKKNKKEKLPEAVILNWFTQIAAALNYIHSHKILHRDIKTSNIFLNSNGDIKIGDFGISRVLENTHDSA